MPPKDAALDRYNALTFRNFRLALAVRFFDGLAIQILAVAVGWQIYELTRDPLLLGLIGLAEGLPYIVVALWAGHQIDRREKSSIIWASETCAFLGALALWRLALIARPQLTLIYALLAWGGLCRSFQWAALTTYVQMIVPSDIFPRAAAWSTTMWQTAMIVGPTISGLTYRCYGAAATYAVAATCFLAAASCAGGLRALPVSPQEPHALGIDEVFSGVRFIASNQIILAAMTLDMFGVLFGGVDGVLPIFAARLGAGAVGLGLLRAASAVGALACSLYLAHYDPFRRMGSAFLTAVAVFGLCMVFFAFSNWLWLSMLILMVSGVADGISMVIRSSIYQARTPDHLRGRVAAVNGIFIRSSNQIGALESGLAARLMGLVPSVVFGGCVTLASVAVTIWRAPQLRRLET